MKKLYKKDLLEKELLLKVYSRVNIFVGFILLILLFVYFSKFPEGMFGTIDKGLFNLDIAVAYNTNIVIFNTPLLVFIGMFLFNLGILIYAITGEKVDIPQMTESILYNTILSFLLIVSQVVLFFVIPGTVNGEIVFGFFKYEFFILTADSVSGINFGYIIITLYTLYNIYIVYFMNKNKEIDFKKAGKE